MSVLNLLSIIIALGAFLSVLELVRRRGLREEYSLMWLIIAASYLFVAIWPNTIRFISDLLDLERPIIAVMFISINFLMLILLQYSIRLSKLTNRYKDLSQQIAIIDHELSITANNLYKINKSNKAYFYILAASIAAREKYSQADIEHKVKIIRLISDQLNLNKEEIEALEFAAILHDIGKIRIPMDALYKTSQLNNEEWENIKKHPLTSVSIVEGIPFLLASIPIIQYHHEHWDGSGYPEGIQGEAIPIGARILHATESLVALTSDRPYRTALSSSEALIVLKEGAGNQYDPKIIDLLEKSWDQITVILGEKEKINLHSRIAEYLPPEEELSLISSELPAKSTSDLGAKSD